MERIRRRGLEIVLGLALAAALFATVVLVWESFSGTFSDKITVRAELADAGDSLTQGDIVTYRNVIIGEVSSTTGRLDGSAVAELRIDPDDAKQIPATVTAVAVPASLFGNTKVELIPARDASGPSLRDGGVVRAETGPAAESLQTALSNVYTLLTSVHPAQLDVALSALATALDGQGARLNTLLGRADRYLRKLVPYLPDLDSVITDLATVTQTIARNAPALLASLRDGITVAKGILRDKQVVNDLLAVAPNVLDNTQRVFNPRTVDNIVTIFRGQVPVSAALARNPDAVADTLRGFKRFADTFTKTLSDGPYLKVNLVLTGVDFVQLLNAAGGQKGNIFHAIVNPPEYTARDCPRYDGADGPNCQVAGTNGASYRLLTAGRNYGGTASSIGSPREQRVLRDAAASLTRTPAARFHDATTDLLLGPLLRGAATVIR